jgi:hypothetical protein
VIVKSAFERSKKTLLTASTLMRAWVVSTSGSVTVAEPLFGTWSASTSGYVWPPSSERLILTSEVLTGGRSVFALSQVTVCCEPPSQVTAVFGEVTRNGPALVASVSVVPGALLFTPPRPSRTVTRKWSEDGT